jgi:hypothetical protein
MDPKNPEEADKADPGEMTQIKARQREQHKGKYGSTPFKSHKPPETEEEKKKKKSWIEIVLVDEDNDPVPGEAYRIILPDGYTQAEGSLDEKGFARVDGIEPGTCNITFPNLDKSGWKPA